MTSPWSGARATPSLVRSGGGLLLLLLLLLLLSLGEELLGLADGEEGCSLGTGGRSWGRSWWWWWWAGQSEEEEEQKDEQEEEEEQE